MRSILTRTIPALALAIPLAALGCGDDGGGGPDAGTPDTMITPDAPPAGTVVGSQVTTYVTAAGEQQVPTDLTGVIVQALIPDGNGGYTRNSGTGLADGTFSIPDVPSGTYVLRVGNQYLETTARDVDLGSGLLGRSDGVNTTAQTDLTFAIDQMSPYAGGSLDFHAPDVFGLYFNLELDADTPPADNDTQLAFTVDYNAAAIPGLISAADASFVLHRELDFDGVESYTVATQIANIPAFDMTDGQATTAPAASFVNIARDQSSAITFEGALFDAVVPDLSIGTPLFQPAADYTLYVSPYTLDHGDLGVIEIARFAAGDAAAHSLTIDYGNPFPVGWAFYETASMLVISMVDEPSQTIGVGFATVVDAAGGLGTIALRTGVVGNPTVDGLTATVPANMSATPVIAWAAATGADAYSVTIREATGGRGTPVATLRTTGTEVTVPDGLLSAGTTYFFEITAEAADGTDFDSEPRRLHNANHSFTRRPTAGFTVQ